MAGRPVPIHCQRAGTEQWWNTTLQSKGSKTSPVAHTSSPSTLLQHVLLDKSFSAWINRKNGCTTEGVVEVTVKGTKAAHVSLSPQTNENPEISSKERPKSVDWLVRGYTDIDESVLGGLYELHHSSYRTRLKSWLACDLKFSSQTCRWSGIEARWEQKEPFNDFTLEAVSCCMSA